MFHFLYTFVEKYDYVKFVTMTVQKKKELKERQKELIDLMLTKAGINKKDIYSVALTNWVNKI